MAAKALCWLMFSLLPAGVAGHSLHAAQSARLHRVSPAQRRTLPLPGLNTRRSVLPHSGAAEASLNGSSSITTSSQSCVVPRRYIREVLGIAGTGASSHISGDADPGSLGSPQPHCFPPLGHQTLPISHAGSASHGARVEDHVLR